MKKFYITTPTKNVGRYIDDTISSIVTQSGNFEIYYHIQDRESTDDTIEHIHRWDALLKEQDSPLKQCVSINFSWSSEQDSGMYDAINKGFSHLNIPDDGIMAWLNADDIYFQYSFSTAAKAFTDIESLEWMGCVIGLLHPCGTFEPCHDYAAPYPPEVIQAHCCDGYNWRVLQQNGMFWKKSLWDKVGGLDARLRYAGDFALWPRFAEHAPFMHYPFVMGTFRLREGQLSAMHNYVKEMNTVIPADIRSKALHNISLQKGWGGIDAPTLEVSRTDGTFSISSRKVWPPIFERRSHNICIRLPRLSLAMRLWLPGLHSFMKKLPRKIRSLLAGKGM